MLNLAGTMAFQVAQVPVLIFALGTAGYSQWLLVSAIPTLLSLSDIGLATTGATEAAIQWSKGRIAQARTIYRSYTGVAGGIACVSAIGFGVAVLSGGLVLPNSALDSSSSRLTFLLLIGWSVSTLMWSLYEGAVRIVGRPALGILGLGLGRVGDLAGLCGSALLDGRPAVIAGSLLIWRAIGFVAYLGAFGSLTRPLTGNANFALGVLRSLALPSFGAISFTVAVNVGSQGLILVAAPVLTPAELTVLNVARIMGATTRQVNLAIGYGVLPEVTRAGAADEAVRVRGLISKVRRVSVLLALVAAVGVCVLGTTFVHWYTGGLAASPWLFAIIAVGMVLDSLWIAPYVYLISVNQQALFGMAFVIATGVGLGVARSLGPYGPIGIAIGLAVGSLLTSMASFLGSKRYRHRRIPKRGSTT